VLGDLGNEQPWLANLSIDNLRRVGIGVVQMRWWVAIGCIIGFGMMAKYTMGFLVIGIVVVGRTAFALSQPSLGWLGARRGLDRPDGGHNFDGSHRNPARPRQLSSLEVCQQEQWRSS
jgi:hypothetical protein